MNINPKDRRNYHGLTVDEKKVLFTAIHKAIKTFNPKYVRMFTEPRVKGYRCKLWYGKLDWNPAMVADHIYTTLRQTFIGHAIKEVKWYYSNGGHMGGASPCFYVIFN